MEDLLEQPDRRRLHRSIPWTKAAAGQYLTADSMRAVQRSGARRWVEGVRQPYHRAGQFDFAGTPHRRLRDAQASLEAAEATDPRREALELPFHDRRGL